MASCVLDGEAVPAGGLGLARQVKDEIYGCPPVLVLIGRPQDSWLAAWRPGGRGDLPTRWSGCRWPRPPRTLLRARLGARSLSS